MRYIMMYVYVYMYIGTAPSQISQFTAVFQILYAIQTTLVDLHAGTVQ